MQEQTERKLWCVYKQKKYELNDNEDESAELTIAGPGPDGTVQASDNAVFQIENAKRRQISRTEWDE